MSRGRRGLSIGEVLFALALLALSFMALLNLLVSGPRAARRAQHEVIATTMARSLIEQKRAAFGTLSTPPDLTPFTSTDGVVFTPTYQAFDVPGTDNTYLRGLQVQVGWTDHGVACNVTLETQVSDVLEN